MTTDLATRDLLDLEAFIIHAKRSEADQVATAWEAIFMVEEVLYDDGLAEAEARNERYFEDRGWEEALAFERWEEERGVISFRDAMDSA